MQRRDFINLCAFVIALFLMAPVAAGPFEDAAAADAKGDYATVLRLMRPLADHGVANAQGTLGNLYAKGQGVQQDYVEAMRWYRLAADQGNSNAQANLGVMYDTGKGVPQDYQEAVKWYRLAADQSNALAQCNLGLMYARGQGTAQNYAEAVNWLGKAAQQGDATAQYNLGIMHAAARGVPQDYVRAHLWFSLAAEQKYPNAIQNRDRAAQLMTQEQLAQADRLAREWRSKRTVELVRSTVKNEHMTIQLPDGYVIDFVQRTKERAIMEMVPSNETVKNWTEMVTHLINVGLKVTPEEYRARLEKVGAESCSGSQLNTISQSVENGYAMQIWMQICPLNSATGKPEITMFKAVQGNDNFYMVNKAFKFMPSQDQVANWMQYLNSVTLCDTRLSERACQASKAQ
jgi:hypothetical protein